MALYQNGKKIAGYTSGRNSAIIKNITIPSSEFILQEDGTYLYTYSSDLVLEESIVDVYFSDDTQPIGIKAGVCVTSETGKINFRAKKIPTGALIAETIRIINPSQDDSYNEDYTTEIAELQNPTFEDYSSIAYNEDFDTSLGKVASKGLFSKILEGIKGSLINLNTRLTSCNNDLKNYLPLTGGTLTGQILYLNGGTSRWLSNGSSIQLEQIDTAGNTDNRTVLLINSNKTDLANSIKMFRVTDGRISSYKLYGDHNPHRRTLIGQSSDTNISEKPWFKVASLSVSEAYSDSHIVFFVRNTYGTDFSGILVCKVRTNSAGAYERCNFYWLCSNASLAKSNFILAYKPNVTPCLAEIWCKVPVSWQGVQFDVISEGTRTNFDQKWSLTASGLTNGGYAEITSGYTQIVSV